MNQINVIAPNAYDNALIILNFLGGTFCTHMTRRPDFETRGSGTPTNR